MTEVAFHFNLPDKLAYACRLLRKAQGSGARVLVVAGNGAQGGAGNADTVGGGHAHATDQAQTRGAQLLHQLDQALWTFAQQEFVPHCLASAAPEVLAASPIVLASSVSEAAQAAVATHWPQADVLLNLGEAVPAGFESFLRLIELVSLDDSDRQAARQRWKHYSDRGYPLVRHDLGGKAS
jgi:DNA polymerase III subunit chi